MINEWHKKTHSHRHEGEETAVWSVTPGETRHQAFHNLTGQAPLDVRNFITTCNLMTNLPVHSCTQGPPDQPAPEIRPTRCMPPPHAPCSDPDAGWLAAVLRGRWEQLGLTSARWSGPVGTRKTRRREREGEGGVVGVQGQAGGSGVSGEMMTGGRRQRARPG